MATSSWTVTRGSNLTPSRDNFHAAGKISLNAPWHAECADGFFSAYSVGAVGQQQSLIVFKNLDLQLFSTALNLQPLTAPQNPLHLS